MKFRRRSRSRTVRGKPNYLWIASAGTFGQLPGATARGAILEPGDWSGTVTETQCTLCRCTLILNALTTTASGDGPFRSNYCVGLHWASDATGESLDLDNYTEWPDFFAKHDRVLRIGILEYENVQTQLTGTGATPLQFSQLPDPVINFRNPRKLKGDDSLVVWVGGGPAAVGGEVRYVKWYARSLVRTGLK